MTSTTQKLRVVVYGTAHSHAPGKVRALLDSPAVELVGVCEPDTAQRERAAGNPVYARQRWIESAQEFLGDPSVAAVCVEGAEGKCAALARECIAAGKHIWYDKPVGDFEAFRWMTETARERRLHIQMGYMLRYSTAFQRVAEWLRQGLLGELFAVRGHMSRFDAPAARGRDPVPGGIAFQLAPHMMDQALWLFGARPKKVTSFLRNDATPALPEHADNTLVVLEFGRAAAGAGNRPGVGGGGGMAMIDIAAMEASPATRRFEVYGTKGSAIVVEPFEPGTRIRLALEEAGGGYARGEQLVEVEAAPRGVTFPRELASFVATIRGEQAPDRSLDHELLVEETLHRAIGNLPA
ncbi:MAG: hypothetical protein AVDCRST_MAG77-1073 [uncultured Chloroflexi bacterium]|uniref:Gfo/Idh/MocA family oxidoreductase n=1 Tax=uncultured Chloroflexota bacterium TaxID=166587 RepID=A0A6J4HRR8_9CHLR|nr:MAG: hypothetical protein AVDCRST_MAG77-1073 [uncultured Chloroflexota bacterium]